MSCYSPITGETIKQRKLGLLLSCCLLVALGALGSACQQYSSTHGSGNPWLVNQPMRQITSILDFHYAGYTEGGASGVRGTASVRPGLLPAWAAYYDQATLMVYVTNQRGRILEQHKVEVASGRPVAEPIAFEVSLDSPVRMDDQSFYISFGYFLILSEFDPLAGNPGRKLIRHEAGYK